MRRAHPRRIFIRRRSLPRIRLLHLLAAVAVLAACTPRTEVWSPAESPKRNVVNWAEFHHPVRFAPNSARLSIDEQRSLDRFLGRVAGGEGVRIRIAAHDGDGTTLSVQREAEVAAYLRQRGFRPELGSASAAAPDRVGITVGRYVVTPPRCPDWTKPASGDPANTASSNLGCATEANLGLMVADPGVLLRGYALGPADGTAMAKSVQDYRENTMPWLPATAGFKIEGSTGGDGNSDSGSGK